MLRETTKKRMSEEGGKEKKEQLTDLFRDIFSFCEALAHPSSCNESLPVTTNRYACIYIKSE